MLGFLLLAFCALVQANTEMINFRLADLPTLSPLPDALAHLKPCGICFCSRVSDADGYSNTGSTSSCRPPSTSRSRYRCLAPRTSCTR